MKSTATPLKCVRESNVAVRSRNVAAAFDSTAPSPWTAEWRRQSSILFRFHVMERYSYIGQLCSFAPFDAEKFAWLSCLVLPVQILLQTNVFSVQIFLHKCQHGIIGVIMRCIETTQKQKAWMCDNIDMRLHTNTTRGHPVHTTKKRCNSSHRKRHADQRRARSGGGGNDWCRSTGCKKLKFYFFKL